MDAPIPLRRMRSSEFLSEEPSPVEEQIFGPPSDETTFNVFPAWRQELFGLLERPNSSAGAFLIHVFTTFLILLSATVTVLETIPQFHSISTRVWFGFETSIVALFTVEYILRIVAWSTTWTSLFKWFISFFGIIDLLAILPYYIELILLQDTSIYFRFSILRMFRLIRVFRPFRYNHTILLTIEVMYLSVRRSQHALFAIGFFVIMILTVFSTLLYFAERGTWDNTIGTFVNSDGDPSQFSSIPASAWFVLVTITTVGYGEITPRSFLGRLITLPLLVCGLLLIALPSFVLGREFSLVWESMIKSPQDRDEDIHTHRPLFSSSPSGSSNTLETRDLTNRKLAMNQTELHRQLVDMRAQIDTQSAIMRRLLDRLNKLDAGRMEDDIANHSS